VLVLIGHGYDTQNIGEVLPRWKRHRRRGCGASVDKLKAKQFICINTTPSSSPWAQSLARKTGWIITATNAASMRATTYFSEFMLRALQPGNVLDAPNAFNKASQNTFDWYQTSVVEKEIVTVHGKEFQEVFKRLYPNKTMIPRLARAAGREQHRRT